jgi:hypothetical protein
VICSPTTFNVSGRSAGETTIGCAVMSRPLYASIISL